MVLCVCVCVCISRFFYKVMALPDMSSVSEKHDLWGEMQTLQVSKNKYLKA